jgi:hypothetical protein
LPVPRRQNQTQDKATLSNRALSGCLLTSAPRR